MCERCHGLSRRRLLSLGAGAVVAAVATASPSRATSVHAAQVGVEVAPGLTILPRDVWAGPDRPPLAPMAEEEVRFLLVHHTASPNGADPIQVMRGAYALHTGSEKGWPDVAYNFFVDEAGTVYEGRAGSLDGPVEADATGGSQGFAQLVCLLGDFTDVLPTDAALDSLVLTLAWLADRYGVDTSTEAAATFVSRGSDRWPEGTEVVTTTIAGHRDMSATACPGDTFYPYLIDRTRFDVEAAALPPASTTTTTTSSTSAPETAGSPGETTRRSRPPSTPTPTPRRSTIRSPRRRRRVTTRRRRSTRSRQPRRATRSPRPRSRVRPAIGRRRDRLGTVTTRRSAGSSGESRRRRWPSSEA